MTQEQKSVFRPVCRNTQNNDAYFYCGQNKFLNIRTGQEGHVSDEVAAKVFVINVEASQILNEYPMAAELINKLCLKFNNNKK